MDKNAFAAIALLCIGLAAVYVITDEADSELERLDRTKTNAPNANVFTTLVPALSSFLGLNVKNTIDQRNQPNPNR